MVMYLRYRKDRVFFDTIQIFICFFSHLALFLPDFNIHLHKTMLFGNKKGTNKCKLRLTNHK